MPSDAETELENLLAAAATDAASVPAFLAALLDATVIAPGLLGPETAGTGQTLNLPPLVDGAGTVVQPFYTSAARLQETLAANPEFERRYLSLNCRTLWEATKGATLMLNPNSSYRKEFLPAEIEQLLTGRATMVEHVVAAPTEVLVGEPASVPTGMTDALSTLFARFPEVARAYLGWKVTPATGDQSYLLVIVGDAATRDAIADELSRALVYYSQPHPVDIIYAQHGDQHLLLSIPPFYRRVVG